MFIELIFTACAFIRITTCNDADRGTVKLPNGVELHGEQFQEGGTHVYYGIKYGIARRFEHAKLNTDFSYLKDPYRLKPGYSCPHIPVTLAPGVPKPSLSMSEDCLYLDVYVPPADAEGSNLRPVLFWIFGGGFKSGEKDLYNATILAKAVNAIVVTVSYRLSAFGFLSTGDDEARGNWAIGDLKLALNWTIDNIAAFGGDPNTITLFGQSSGAVLTSALLLDDDVRYKVKAGIAFSGSQLSGWGMTKDPKAGTLALAGYLGCPNTTSAAAVACLKALPYEVLLNGTTFLENQKEAALGMYYAPVVDGVHLLKLPEDILRDRAANANKYSTGKSARLITGYMREDTSLLTLSSAPYLLADNFTHTYSSALRMLAGFNIALSGGRCPPSKAGSNAKAAFDFYNISQNVSSDEALNAYHRIASDMMFGGYAMKESMLYANISDDGNQMFLISFDSGFRRLGAFHCMDIFHLFRGAFDMFLKDKTSEELSKTLHDYVRQIAYTGRYEGPYFGREGNYHELTQEAKFVNKKADFSAKVRLLQDILQCGFQ